MATREELVQKYQQDRKEKLLKLYAIFGSQISQEVRKFAEIKNNVSVISSIYTINDLYKSDEELWNFVNLPPVKQGSKLRSDFESKFSTKDEIFAYLSLYGYCNLNSSRSDNNGGVPITISVSEVLYLRNIGETEASSVDTVSPYTERISVVSYKDLSKALSIFSYPIRQLYENKNFYRHIEDINYELDLDKKLPVNSIPVIVIPSIDAPDGVKGEFNSIFPKPEGWDELYGESNSTQSTTPSTLTTTPTSRTPENQITPTSTTQVTSAPTTTPSTTSTTTSSTSTPVTTSSQNTKTKTGGSKYLSIESIKDDDPVIPQNSTGRRKVLSLVSLKDDDPTVGDYQSSNEIKTIQTQKSESESNEQPKPPTTGINTEVANKEIEQITQSTDAQRKGEESDAIERYNAKLKSSTSPAGGNPELSEGRATATEERSKPVPEDKKPEPINHIGVEKTFDTWRRGEEGRVSGDGPGIWYRGEREKTYPKTDPQPVPIIKGIKTDTNNAKYKSLFSFGTNKNAFFKGYASKINSPIDVALLCNPRDVGLFNKNIPYTFSEGSETHLIITNADGVERKNEGGIGNKEYGKDSTKIDANWAHTPFWCGFTVDFLLYKNGEYKSDSNDKPIVGTSSVDKYFNEEGAAVNPDGGTKSQKEQIIKSKNKDIESKKTQIKSLESEIIKLNSEKAPKEKELDNILANTTGKSSSELKREKTLTIKIDGINRNISNKETTKKQYEEELKVLEKEKSQIENTPEQKYNPNGNIVKFKLGEHFDKKGLTSEGLELWELIKKWPGAYIVRRKKSKNKTTNKIDTSGHTELVLHFGKDGRLFVIFGNSGFTESVRDGNAMGFKKYATLYDFMGDNTDATFSQLIYFVRRGDSIPYTNGIGFTVKKTELYQNYVDILNKKEKSIISFAYNNVLREIMEV
jgi:hypothetical protein